MGAELIHPPRAAKRAARTLPELLRPPDVCRLRVVVEIDSLPVADPFDPVRKAREGVNGCLHGRSADIHGTERQSRRP